MEVGMLVLAGLLFIGVCVAGGLVVNAILREQD